jgi:hypothetical protein
VETNSQSFYVEVVVPVDDRILGQLRIAVLATLPKTISSLAILEPIQAGTRLTMQEHVQNCKALPDAVESPPEALRVSELARRRSDHARQESGRPARLILPSRTVKSSCKKTVHYPACVGERIERYAPGYETAQFTNYLERPPQRPTGQCRDEVPKIVALAHEAG